MATDRAAKEPGLLDVLRQNPAYRRLYAAMSISRLGTAASLIALEVATANLTGTAPWPIAVVLALTFGPQALFSWLSGPLVDRLHRGWIMLAADLTRAVLMVAAVFADSITELYAISLGLGIATAFFTPAYQSLLPDTVGKDDLLRANSLLYSTRSFIDIAGPGLAYLLISVAGVDVVFLLDATSYVVSGVFVVTLILARMGLPPETAQAEGNAVTRFFTDLAQGLAYHRRVPVIRDLLFLIGLTAVSAGGLNALLTVLTVQHFQEAAPSRGLISMLMAAGATLGNLSLVPATQLLARRGVLAAGYLLSGSAALLLLAAPSYRMALALFFLAGFANAGFHAPPETWVQEAADPRLRGRVFALRGFVLNLGMVISMLASGAVTAAVGVAFTWSVLAGLMILCAVLTLALPSLRAQPGTPAAARAGADAAG